MWLHELEDVTKYNHSSRSLPLSSPTPPTSPSSSASPLWLCRGLRLPSLNFLHHHSAIVTALFVYAPPSLPFPCNLPSADVDDFVHLKTLPSIYRRAINDLALHRFDKLALSVGRDKFSLWSTSSTARGASTTFASWQGGQPHEVQLSAVGDRFFKAMKDKVTVHEAEDA